MENIEDYEDSEPYLEAKQYMDRLKQENKELLKKNAPSQRSNDPTDLAEHHLSLTVFPVTVPCAPLSYATVQWDVPETPAEYSSSGSGHEVDFTVGSEFDWTSFSLSSTELSYNPNQEVDTKTHMGSSIEDCSAGVTLNEMKPHILVPRKETYQSSYPNVEGLEIEEQIEEWTKKSFAKTNRESSNVGSLQEKITFMVQIPDGPLPPKKTDLIPELCTSIQVQKCIIRDQSLDELEPRMNADLSRPVTVIELNKTLEHAEDSGDLSDQLNKQYQPTCFEELVEPVSLDENQFTEKIEETEKMSKIPDAENTKKMRTSEIHTSERTEKFIIPVEKESPEQFMIPDEKESPEQFMIPDGKESPEQFMITDGKESSEQFMIPDGKESSEQFMIPDRKESPEQFVIPDEKESSEQFMIPDEKESSEQFVIPDEKESSEQFMIPDGKESPEQFMIPDGKESPEQFMIPDGKESSEQFMILDGKESPEQFVILDEKESSEQFVIPDGKESPEQFVIPDKKESSEQFVIPNGKESSEQFLIPDKKESSEQFVILDGKESSEQFLIPDEKESPEQFVIPDEKESPEQFVIPDEKESSEQFLIPDKKESSEQFVIPDGKESSEQFVILDKKEISEQTICLDEEKPKALQIKSLDPTGEPQCSELAEQKQHHVLTDKEVNHVKDKDMCAGGWVQETVLDMICHHVDGNVKLLDWAEVQRLAERLYRLDGFKRTDVVRHLDKDNDFSRAVGEEYLKYFDFNNQSLEQALRSFLKEVVLIGETQERERVLQHFSSRFQQCNPDTFSSSGAVLTLTCAVMLLNTDLHGQNVGKPMTLAEFVSNLEGMNSGENFSKDCLKSLYNSIKSDPLRWAIEEDVLAKSMTLEQDLEQDGSLRSKSNPFQDLPHNKRATVFQKGFLKRKAHADIDGKRTPWGKRSWKTFYVVLKGMVLYLQKDEYQMDWQSSEEVVSVHHALAERALNYTKKPHVFRLQTADWRVFLFEATSTEQMNSWMGRINLVSALYSSPPFPAAVGSQKKFSRPILPASQSNLKLDKQLESHAAMLENFHQDLNAFQQGAPDGRKNKARESEELRQREEYLQYEKSRYEVYVKILETWQSIEPSPSAVGEKLNMFDEGLWRGELNGEETEGVMKRSLSSPSLELEAPTQPVVKVRRNISERRTYRKIVIPRRNKEL